MDLSRISVLIIDDDSWITRLLVKIFDRLEMRNIFVANNAFDGIAMVFTKKPNIIFLDIMMPDLNGLQVLKLLKSIPDTQNIPVLMISGNTDYANVGTAISQGACGFVSKPFTFEIIKEKMEKIIQNNVLKVSNEYDSEFDV